MARSWTTPCAATVALLSMFCVERAAGALDVGYDHVCATVGTTLKCWGSNGYGQLGRGDTETTGDEPDEMGDNLVPVDFGSGEIIMEVALGTDFTCGLLESGQMKCFGLNDEGQLGQGDILSRGDEPGEMGDALPAVDLGTDDTVRAITTGCRHTCALLDTGAVKCFGYNNYGQLGQGHKANIGDDPSEMGENLTAVDIGMSAKAVSAGCDFTCALTEEGNVMCWGRNTHGQLGIGSNEDLLDEPGENLVVVDVGGGAVFSIAAGESHVCARLEDASVKCWGLNNNGQLGYGDNASRGDLATNMGVNLPSVDYGLGSSPVALDSGDLHTCTLMSTESIKCFGDNAYGQLGIGSTSDIGDEQYEMGANLTAIDLGGNATEVAAGEATTCARLTTGGVKCWGQANLGQLGQGDTQEIGIIPGDLADLPEIDLGTALRTDAPTASPTPAPTGPTLSPSYTEAPSTPGPAFTPAPFSGTLAPGASPSESSAPSTGADAEASGSSGALGVFSGKVLVTAAVCVAGLAGLLL